MTNASIRRLIGGLGTALIFLICAVVIGAHFLTGRSLQRIDVSEYTTVESDGAGGYTASLDIDRLITKERLHNPTETEKAQYPEIAALKGLAIRITPRGDGYEFETVTSGEDPTALLKEHGIRLINTKWSLSRTEIAAAAGQRPAQTTSLDFSSYVRTNRTDSGDYTAAVDIRSMLRDAGIDADADPETNVGARALRSLDVACAKTDNGYKLQTTSTLPSVMEDLSTAGIKITNTQWTWSAAEMEKHVGTVTPPDAPRTPVPETPVPATPDAQETPAPTTPSGTFNDTPGRTPETGETTAAPERNPNAITTLYGFDQTELRTAIRAAKEQKYGSGIESSEVKYNYFAVGSDSTPHGNVFRIVYVITTSKGTEYLAADVYDVELETGYKASDVHLTVKASRTAAKSTDDFKDYTVYTLNEGSMVFPENKDKSPFDKDGLVMAKSIKEAVSYDELWDIPTTDDMTLLKLLGYARNEMFARGGHKFGDSSTYLKYYKQFSWYKPTGKVTADELAAKYPATKKNITTIKFLENLIKEG